MQILGCFTVIKKPVDRNVRLSITLYLDSLVS